MPIARVQVPDGRVMRLEVPDGTTPDQVEQFVAQKLGESAPETDDSLSGRIKQDFSTYQQRATEAAQNPSMAQSMARGASAAANLGMEVAGEFVPQPIKDVSGYLAEKAIGLVQKMPGAKSYSQAWENQPQVAKDIEQAIFDVSGLAGTGAGIKAGAGMARRGVNTLSEAAPMAKPHVAQPMTLAEKAAAARSEANALYREQANVKFTPEQTRTIVDNIMKTIPKDDLSRGGFMDSAAGKQAEKILRSVAVEQPTLEGLLDRRARLNDDWADAKFSGANKTAADLDKVKRALDDVMINPETGAWQDANRAFGIAATKQDFSSLVAKAANRAQPANSLDTAINNYLLSPEGKRLRPEEAAVLKQITEDSYSKEMKRAIASRLTRGVGTIIGSQAGLFGGLAGDALGTIASKFVRDKLFENKVAALEEFFDTLDTRPIPAKQQAAPVAPKPMLALPSPDSARAMTPDQIKAARDQINRKPRAPSGDLERNPNMEGIKSTVQRNTDGTLERAPLMSLPYRNTNAYKNLPYIKQRFVDKIVQDYTGGKSKAEVVRDMARRGQISPQDASEILDSLYEIKIRRNR